MQKQYLFCFPHNALFARRIFCCRERCADTGFPRIFLSPLQTDGLSLYYLSTIFAPALASARLFGTGSLSVLTGMPALYEHAFYLCIQKRSGPATAPFCLSGLVADHFAIVMSVAHGPPFAQFSQDETSAIFAISLVVEVISPILTSTLERSNLTVTFSTNAARP